MLTLTICVLRDAATRQRAHEESVKKLLMRLDEKHPDLYHSDFFGRFLRPLRVLKYPLGSRPESDLYRDSFILNNGLEILTPRHEPKLFQSVLKSLIAEEAKTMDFEYDQEELVLVVRYSEAEAFGAEAQLQLKMLNHTMRLLEDETLSKRQRVQSFEYFCKELLSTPQQSPWRPAPEELKAEALELLDNLKDLGVVYPNPKILKLDLSQIEMC